MCLQCRVGLQYSRYYQRASTVFAKKILTSMSGFTLGDPRHLNSHVDTRLKSHTERHTSVLSSSYHDYSRFACGENAIYSEPSPSSLSLRRPLQLMGFVLTKLISPITRWLPLTKRPQKKGKRVICSADITFICIGGSNNIVNQIPEWILFSV